MKYYEIHEPYYALLAAEDENKAVEVYIQRVADDDGTLRDNIKEVGHLYALAAYCKSVGYNEPYITAEEAIKNFENSKNDILLTDGDLI